MDKEKRNIAIVAETESKYLTNILDKKDVQQFRKLIPELKDTWRKKQMFRTETEMRFSVLSDNKYPTRAAKYWQSVREQNTHFENLMHLSFDARKNAVEIKKLERKVNKEKAVYKKLFAAYKRFCRLVRVFPFGEGEKQEVCRVFFLL